MPGQPSLGLFLQTSIDVYWAYCPPHPLMIVFGLATVYIRSFECACQGEIDQLDRLL